MKRAEPTPPKPEESWDALDFEIQQLFTPAAPINEAELFAGRFDQIRRLLEAVSERGRHAVLYGERGVGKTSLATTFHMLVKQIVNRQIMPIRKPAGPTDTFTSLWKRVFDDMQIEALIEGREESISVSTLYAGEMTPDDVVRELRRVSLNQIPLIIFDEFDKLPNVDAKALMSHTIKAISDEGLNTTVLIVGVAEDIDSLIAEHQSVGRNITEIKMPRMSNDELNQVLDKRYPRVQMKVHPDARWKIVTLSRGLPSYVHALGKDSARTAIRRKSLSIIESDVDSAIRELIKESDQTTARTYTLATQSNKKNALYRQVLTAAAIAKTDDEGRFAPFDVVEPLSKILNRKVTIANFLGHLNAFCEADRGSILERRGSTQAYRYRFKEPKMQPYVIMRGIADGVLSEEGLSILSSPEQPRLSSEF